MAMKLTLRQIVGFKASYDEEQIAAAQSSPLQHFNVFFAPFFGLPSLPNGGSPDPVVDIIRKTLKALSICTVRCKFGVRKMLWAHKKRNNFLVAVVHLHRQRWKSALQSWEAIEQKQQQKDIDALVLQLPKPVQKSAARWYFVPKKKKMKTIASLHRHKIQEANRDVFDWIEQKATLKKMVQQVSKQVVKLWLEDFLSTNLLPLATRLGTLRKRFVHEPVVLCVINAVWRFPDASYGIGTPKEMTPPVAKGRRVHQYCLTNVANSGMGKNLARQTHRVKGLAM